MDEEQQQEQPQPQKSAPKKRLLLIGAVMLLVTAAVAAAFFVFAGDEPAPETAKSGQQEQALSDPEIKPNLYAQGLEQPTGITATPDAADERLFVLEQPGRIKIISAGQTVLEQPFLDVTDDVQAGGELGLLGLAFHPDYQENGYFYVNYTDTSRVTTIVRYQVSDDANRADPASRRVLLTVEQPFANHNGGDLAFGPDGYLYVALGDGGSGGDPQNNAQDTDTLLGKLLRLDVDSGEPYTVPETNPFAGGGGEPEIWAYGLRNPWRISFDKQTGELYIADVGQGELEELNVQSTSSEGGENYGWRCMEGDSEFNPAGCPEASAFTAPVLEYTHDEDRCSITGGYVYRGEQYPALDGKYFYGDYCSGEVFTTSAETDWQQQIGVETSYRISAFGQDSRGELYFADHASGAIYMLQDTAN